MSEGSLTGGCVCGGIRFELSAAPGKASYCHCTRCQHRTGTAASAQAWVDGAHFHLMQGEELLRAWRHPDGGYEKLFCRECGGHIMSRDPEDHTRMSVRMGAFDGDPGIRPAYRQFLAYAAPWEPVPDDGTRRYQESGRTVESDLK